jgi:uncharacterized protein YjeT (DUF2065 family)
MPGPGSGIFVGETKVNDFLAAVALMLVIEGVLPFLSPSLMRGVLLQMIQMDDRALRITGLISMISGVILLYLAK